jgi:O-antigen/teichoic acid export membrane protein
MIPKELDAVVLGYFRNPAEVGYYKLAKSMSAVGNYLILPLQSVTYVELARLESLGYKQALLQRVRSMTIWIGLPSGLGLLVGAGFMPFVLPFLVGDIYLPAVHATQLLFIASTIALVFFWLRPLYLAKGLVRQLFLISSSVTIVFALFYPVVVMKWGYMGASGSMLTMYVLGFGLCGVWLWKQLKQTQ